MTRAALKGIYGTALLCTLAITPMISFDPINWVKLLILSVGTFSAIGLWVSEGYKEFAINSKLFLGLVFSFFIIASLSTAASTDVFASFWGNQGRATGLLAYMCLFALSLLVLHIDETGKAELFVKYFLRCCTVAFTYMTLQFLGLDFVSWARNDTFSTLGNINFSSALVGICIPVLFVLAINDRSRRRVVSLPLIFFGIWLGFMVIKSGSIQGLVGAGFALFLLMLSKFPIFAKRAKIFIGVATLFLILLLASLYITTQSGLFGGRLFQETMAFRKDYWIASKNMIESRPILGIGFGQYGNFYRAERDAAATLGSGIYRYSDSAHSILLDVGVSIGLIGLFVFSIIVLLTFYRSLSVLLNSKHVFDHAVALIWLSYIPQFFIGINSLGVSAWSWIAMGLIWSHGNSYSRFSSLEPSQRKTGVNDQNIKHSNRKATKNFQVDNNSAEIPAKGVLARFLGMTLGLALSLAPFIADARFNSEYSKGNMAAMRNVASGIGGSQHLQERTLEFIVSNTESGVEALTWAKFIVAKFPRSDYAWRVIYDLVATPEPLRAIARSRIEVLDPYLVIPR